MENDGVELVENADNANQEPNDESDLHQGIDVLRRVVSIHFECHCRDEDIARMRMELETDPDQLDGGTDCCPPLLHAVIKEHIRCVEFLLGQGAQVNKEYEPLGETPLSSAVTRSTAHIAHIILAKDASGVNVLSSLTHEPPLVRAVKHGNSDIVHELLKYGARPNACAIRNEECVPCVYLAIELGHQKIVTLLLEYGASLHAHTHFDKDNLLYKHVQFTLAEGQIESLKALCLHGALHELAKITLYPELQIRIHCNFPLLCMLFRNNNPLEVNLKLLDMLYEFGFNFWKCDKHDKNAWKKLEQLDANEFSKLLSYKVRRMRSRPLTLKSISRLKIQEIMKEKYVPNINKLQIPETLFSFLRFDDVLFYEL